MNKLLKIDFIYFLFLMVYLLLSYGIAEGQQPEDQIKKQQMQAMYQAYKTKSFPKIPDISAEDLVELKKQEKIILVDVRTPEGWKVSMIPEAITAREFEKNMDRYKENKIIPYCTIGYRSGLYTQKLLKKNVNAFNLIGGVLAWAFAEQKFVGSDGDSLRVHVYDKKWNLLPQGYKAVW
jgi:rhodanese-related sulfurtransferase